MEKLGPVLVVVVILLLIPVVLSLRSKPLDFERIEEEFRKDGFSVTSVRSVNPPEAGARAHMRMTLNASDVDVYLFSDNETLEKQVKTLDKLIQLRNSADLAAAGGGSEFPKTEMAQNGLYVLVVRSRNKQVRDRALYVFKTL